jgi:hypothetical protein
LESRKRKREIKQTSTKQSLTDSNIKGADLEDTDLDDQSHGEDDGMGGGASDPENAAVADAALAKLLGAR